MQSHELVAYLVLSGQVGCDARILDRTRGHVSRTMASEFPRTASWKIDTAGISVISDTPVMPGPADSPPPSYRCIISEGPELGEWMHDAWRQLADDGMALLLRCDSDSALQYCTAGAPSFSFGNADARALIVCKSKRRLDQFAQHMNAFYRRIEALGPTVANYEERVRDFLVQTIKPGWTVVDVGSHVGAHTITMAQLVTNTGRVIAFDAHPQNVSDLRLNGVTFGIDSWLTAEWNAVTDGSTPSVTLYEGRNKWSAEWNLRGFDVCGVKTAPAMDVAAISLDGYFGKQHIDLVKIDVEGAGTGVIRGMAGILATTRPMILLEYHGEDEREVLSALVAARYTLRDVDTGAFVTPETATYHMVCTPQRI